jgi:hypothetical protein
MIKSVNGISGNELGSTGYISIVTSDDLEETIEDKEREKEQAQQAKERERSRLSEAFYDPDAGIEFVFGYGINIGYHSVRTATFGIPVQLGIGANFVNMRLTLLGDFGWYVFTLFRYGVAAEFYFPGRSIGIEAGYGYAYDFLGELAEIEGLSEPNYQRLGINFLMDGTNNTKITLYAAHLSYNDIFSFNGGNWAFGLRIILSDLSWL